MEKTRLKAINLLIATSLLWSIAGFIIKLINLNAMAISGARSGIAAIVILLYLKKPKIKLTKAKLLGSACYAANSLFFVLANKLTTSANTILLQFTAPIWVAIFSLVFLKEKVSKTDWIAIFTVFMGMTLFFLGDLQFGHVIGNIVAIISGAAMAGFVIIAKLEAKGKPVEMVLIGCVFNFTICSPFLIGTVGNIDWVTAGLLFVLGVFQLGIPYILYTKAIKYVSSLEAILITVLEPLLNPVWVFLIAGESPGYLALLGGLIVLSAVVLRGIFEEMKLKESN